MTPQPSRPLGDLLDTLPAHILTGSSDCLVQGVVADSRQVAPGTLFVAVRGLSADGHQFLGDALDQGAAALVVEELPPPLEARVRRETCTVVQVPQSRLALAKMACAYYGQPSRHLRLVGITGTNGKTTTTYVLESILQAAGMSVGVIGTVDYRFGDHRLPAPQTTPDAVCLQSLLQQMQLEGTSHAVMEVSSHAIDQHRVTGCEFDACVFTNLSRDHYDYHGSESAYFEAKARLFADFPGARNVLNVDDPYGQQLRDTSPSHALTYGIDSEASLTPRALDHGLNGIRFTLPTAKGQLEIRSALVGRHNVYNLLAGVATAIALDIDADAITQGIAQLTQVPGRLE
ncbi:MAG: UDP-N-acetylmuramyl-tripeptide synthetase, partial [Candidatus Tectomicrobia bacterium]|nr:UDP-N-acetylmuramyl-tripeptide synthetase [Candidatus Tectomicrobia bacterium]